MKRKKHKFVRLNAKQLLHQTISLPCSKLSSGFPQYNLHHFQCMVSAYVSKLIFYHYPHSIAYSTIAVSLTYKLIASPGYFTHDCFFSKLSSAICMSHCIISTEVTANIVLHSKVLP